MSQGELLRPGDVGLSAGTVAARLAGPLEGIIDCGQAEGRARLIDLMRVRHDATVGDCGLDDTLAAVRYEMRKFADSEVLPYAHGWHRANG
jgi:(2S)-methylsuccinyl-CoA dehydrogenase